MEPYMASTLVPYGDTDKRATPECTISGCLESVFMQFGILGRRTWMSVGPNATWSVNRRGCVDVTAFEAVVPRSAAASGQCGSVIKRGSTGLRDECAEVPM